LDSFVYRDGQLCVEDVPLTAVAERFGTPCYVYSHAALTQTFQSFVRPFGARPHLICYAAKANSSLAILNLFARLGSGFDIVSGGELERVLAAGGQADKVVFSGVGKRKDEIVLALEHEILCFNVESESELARISQLAAATGRTARISLRVNPDVDPKTHPYISTGLKENKFGVPVDEAVRIYRHARTLPGVAIAGIDYHIGSQITEIPPFLDALDKLLSLVDQLRAEGIVLHHLDLGGGLGIRYHDEIPPAPAEYIGALLQRLAARQHTILLEPGRALVGNAGVLLTRVEYLKHGETRNFAIVDAAMNDLLRPAMYEAWHGILPVSPAAFHAPLSPADVVGPVCESSDTFTKGRDLPALPPDSLVAFLDAGAYGASMSSTYNARPLAAEVMVEGARFSVIRDRQSYDTLLVGQRLPAWAAHGSVEAQTAG